MSLTKSYTRINWENYPSTETPLNESNLNKMDYSLNEQDNRIISMDVTKFDVSDANTLIKDISLDSTTGIFTFTRVNGTTFTIDTKLEKLAINFSYDSATNELVIKLDDGTDVKVDLSALIDVIEFENSSHITMTLQANGKFKADLIKNSITGDYLQPNYLADITVQAQTSQQASSDAQQAKTDAEQAKTDAESARDLAEQYKNQAQSIVNIGIATTTQTGLVKPDGTTITVETDGTIHGASTVGVATTTDAGIVKPDGTTITIDNDGTIHSVSSINSASDLSYDNTTSGLTASDVQNAIDELNTNTETVNTTLSTSLYIADDNKNIVFGKNGDGDYGYYKGDGTFTPFKSGFSDLLYVAPPFSNTTDYEKGSVVLYDNILYTAIDDITAHEWDSTEWKRDYLVNLSNTVTPIVEYWKEWAVNGGIDTSLYTDLTSLLNDEIATRKLMTKHASADYLCIWIGIELLNNNTTTLNAFTSSVNAMKWIGLRDYVCDKLMSNNTIKTAMLSSTNWEYILKDHVPVMTSNTAPYGTVIYSSQYSTSYPMYTAFDNNDSTMAAHTNAINGYTGYKFTNPICVRKLITKSNATVSDTFKIQASNDGTTWLDIDTINVADTTTKTTELNNDNYYLYYRLLQTTKNSDNSGYGFYTIQFYGRSLNVSVPTMTSNTEPWGEVISTTTVSGRDSYYAFNASAPGEQLKVWMSNIAGKDSYIGYKFNSNVCVKGVFYIDDCGRSDFTIMYNVTIQGSNNGTVWEDVETYTNTNYSAYFKNIHYLTNSNSYKYWRMKANSLNNSGTELLTDGNAMVPTLNFYGVDYSEREFEEGSTMKYIYDHGVEFESLTQDGYVQANSGSTNAPIVVKDQAVNVWCNGTPTVPYLGMWGTSNKIDLSEFLTAFIYVKSNTVNYNNSMWSSTSKEATEGTIAGISLLPVTKVTNNEGLLNLDLSSVNSEAYLYVRVYGADGLTQASAVLQSLDVIEWWLE